MYALIFRNWKLALLWAIGITASAAAFIEKDGGQAKMQASADQIRAQKEQVAAPAPVSAPAANSAASAENPEAEEPAEGDAAPEGEATDGAA